MAYVVFLDWYFSSVVCRSAFIRPFYGVLLWTIVAFLNPQSFLWGSAATYHWAMAVAIPTISGGLVFSSTGVAVWGREYVLLLALFWIWITITTE